MHAVRRSKIYVRDARATVVEGRDVYGLLGWALMAGRPCCLSPPLLHTRCRRSYAVRVRHTSGVAGAGIFVGLMMFQSVTGWMLGMVLVVSGAVAQVDQDAPAAPAEDQPRFLEHFDASYAVLAYVADPMPHLDGLLRYAPLQRVLESSEFVRNRPGMPNLPQLHQSLLSAEAWIPTEVAFGMPERGLKTADHLVQVYLLGGLAYAAIQSGDEEATARLPQIHAALLPELQNTRLPAMRLWARFRRPEQVNMIFTVTGMYVAQFAHEHELNFTSDANHVEISTTLGQMWFEGVGELLLVEMGLARPDDPDLAALGAAVEKVGFHLRLSRVDGGLLLDIEPDDDDIAQAERPAPLTPADVGTLLHAHPGEIAWARWDTTTLKAAARRWTDTWAAYENTPTGATLQSIDTEGMLDTLMLVVNQVNRTAAVGEGVLWAEGGVRGTMIERGVGETVDLRQHPAAAVVPADCTIYSLDGTASFADELLGYIAKFEDRLATRQFRADLTEDLRDQQTFGGLAEVYYGALAEFRNQIFHKGTAVFTMPSATMVRDGATIGSFELTFNAAGQPIKMSGNDLPMMEIAFVTQPVEKGAAIKWFAETNHALAAGLSQHFYQRDPAEGSTAVQAVDLGLGVPTHTIGMSWLPQLAPEAANLSLQSSGEFVIHLAEVDDLLILSNSPRLTRDMLAAKQDAARRVALPSTDSALVTFGRLDGRTLARLLTHASPWLEMMGDGFNQAAGRDVSDWVPRTVQLLGTVDAFAALLEDATWQAVQDGGVRETNLTLTF